MFCPKCGAKNKDDSAFCGSCGASLRKGTPVAPSSSVNASSATAVPATPRSDASVVAPVVLEPEHDQKTGKSSGSKKGLAIGAIAAAVIVVVVVVAIVTGGFGMMGPSVKGSVEEYTWDELSQISREISSKPDEAAAIEVAKKYNLVSPEGKLDGSQMKMITLSNGQEVGVQIVGFSHDDKTDGGKAGITFMFKDAIGRHAMNSSNVNAGGWEGSEMRSWLASDGINMLPQDLRDKLVTVDKKTNNTGQTQSTTAVTVTSDKLWLFSATELCGTIDWFASASAQLNDVLNAEGSQYKLFRDMEVNSIGANGVLVKTVDGGSCTWWERSAAPVASNLYYQIYTDGRFSNYHASGNNAAVPGFCI